MTLTENSSVMKNGTQGPRKYQHNQKQLQGHTSIRGIPYYFYLLMKKKWFLVSTSRFDLPTTQFEPPPLRKRGGLRFSKFMKMGRGGLNIFAEKEGQGKNGGVCLEMGYCRIILRFFRGFLMTQHRHKILMCFSFLC